MKKKYLLQSLLFSITVFGQITLETFENQTLNNESFISNGEEFLITSNNQNQKFRIQTLFPQTGWNGSGKDNSYIDNSGNAFFEPVEFTIKTKNGTAFFLKSLYLLLAKTDLSSGTGNCIITGKKSGTTVFTASNKNYIFDYDFDTSTTNNNYTFLDMSNYGSSDNSNKEIDEFVIKTTGYFEYVALDGMKWQKVPVLSVSSIGAEVFSSCEGVVSAERNFIVTGSNIVGNVVIKAPTGFEVSADNITYNSSLVLTESNNSIATTVYVRMAANAAGSPSGNINCSTAGIAELNIQISGKVNSDAAPIAVLMQNFSSGKVADLTATGVDLKWYRTPTGGTSLPFTTVLNTGTYYVSQTLECESARTAVQVTVNGAALDFDGVDDYVNLASTQTIAGSFTVEAWVKPAEAAKTMHIISTRDGGDNSFDIQLTGGNRIHGDIGNGSSWLATNADAAYNYTPNNWFHLAYVVTPTGYTIYVNGNNVKTGTFSGTPLFIDSNRPLRLGYYSSEGTLFKGQMDEVRVWSRALSQCDIQNNMSIQLASGQNGLAIYYKLNESLLGTGSTVVSDSSGNNNNATLVNFALNGNTSNWVAAGVVSIDAGSSIASSPQIFCSNATIANLTATGTAIKWYASKTGGSVLAGTTALANNTTYYVSQTVGACESERIPVLVIFDATIWDGNSWSNGLPDASKRAEFTGNYTANVNLSACSVLVSGTAVVNFTSGTNLTVTNAVTVTPTASLTFENNSNLIQTEDIANTGNIIVKRNSASLMLLDYTLWSSPVLGQQLQSFSPETLASRFYTYNSATDLYNLTTPAVNFTAGKSYLIRMPNNHPTIPTIWNGSFTGVPNNGNVSLSVTNDTYNAIGNPYPSTINADEFIDANNLTEALYFWRKTNGSTATSYATYTKVGGAGTGSNSGDPLGIGLVPNGIIQVGQGFIAKSTGTELIFTNAMRTANNSNQFLRTKAVEKHRIWLNLSNESGVFNQMMVAYMNGATSGIDKSIDGRYINDTKTALNSNINDEEFVIQAKGLPFEDTDVVPLIFKTNIDGKYSISIDHADGLFLGNQNVFLKDNLTETIHNIKEKPYSFHSVSGTFNGRFQLIYKKSETLGIENSELNSNNVIVFNQNNLLNINSGNLIMRDISVFDVRSRLLFEQKNINNTTAVLKGFAPAQQALVLQITSDENKVIVKKVMY